MNANCSLNAFVESNVAVELSDPSSNALREDVLARALLSQTQLLTRLRLFLVAVSSNAVHLLFALQHTIDTICDRARVPKHCAKHCATSSLQLRV